MIKMHCMSAESAIDAKGRERHRGGGDGGENC